MFLLLQFPAGSSKETSLEVDLDTSSEGLKKDPINGDGFQGNRQLACHGKPRNSNGADNFGANYNGASSEGANHDGANQVGANQVGASGGARPKDRNPRPHATFLIANGLPALDIIDINVKVSRE